MKLSEGEMMDEESRKAYLHNWKMKNGEKVRAIRHNSYMRHRERRLQHSHDWYMKNKEQYRRRRHEAYLKNRELEFHQHGAWCQRNKEHLLEYQRVMRLSDAYKERRRAEDRKRRLEVLSHYSNGGVRCVRCGFDDLRALSIDHINEDGGEERRREGDGGTALLYRLQKQGYPEGYQVLCMNCQFIKHREYLAEQMTERSHPPAEESAESTEKVKIYEKVMSKIGRGT